MKPNESAKFERFGSFFFLLLLGLGIVLPALLSLAACIGHGAFRMDVFLPMTLVFMFMIWIILMTVL